ncbi:DUF6161 domain-containing protein [Verminephrobacter eiseniae]|uniref:DUF6161 domain-containing protein n=1 Tax=Verminephrobacter eiseniae TaxID=364317 RepID=UPI00223828A3|nr:DUF6161 domain-containing protein [Verminephrobacter eiseniae]MCW5238070.1 hypothetical protein [Verminephrobacter eiseniae]
MMAASVPPTPRPEPLFTLDLKDNGGLFAPATLAEATAWMQREQGFWSWLNNTSRGGNHDQGLKQALNQLNQAINNANQARQYKDSNPQRYQNQLTSVPNTLQEVFARQRLPHSLTPLAARVDECRKAVSDHAASFFAAVFVPPQQGHHFQPQELQGWCGLTEGLIERFGLGSAPQKGRKLAAEQSFEQLRVRAESLVGEKSTAYDALHRDYTMLAESVRLAGEESKTQFDGAQAQRESDFEKLVAEHKQEMESLRKTFREEIALRAPATYWDDKRKDHERLSKITGAISFGGIAVASGGLGWLIHDLLRTAQPNAALDAWRVGVLVMMGMFAVWGVRLVVRMFLSHLHLATDAAERVVMARTYLSLLEGDRLASNEDRQLILQALFRPASDGIVKDEGVPFSLAEVLTRTGKA